MLLDALQDLYTLAYGLIVDIPVNNALGAIYVILNTVVSVLLSLLGFNAGGGGGLLPF